jgi:hypothetical protein
MLSRRKEKDHYYNTRILIYGLQTHNRHVGRYKNIAANIRTKRFFCSVYGIMRDKVESSNDNPTREKEREEGLIISIRVGLP